MDDKQNLKTAYVQLTILKSTPTDRNPDYDYERLSSKTREYLNLKKLLRTKNFDFCDILKDFIELSNGKDFADKASVFKDLHNIFRKLEDYGVRLLKRPWRREFYTIKLFTTFFKHDIKSKLPSAVNILKLYGYKDASQNTVKMMPESLDPEQITSVCFELFLSQIELKVMHEICTKIEEYTNDFTLSDILNARAKTRGDVKKAVKYFFKENSSVIRAKRIKTADPESERKSNDSFDKSTKCPTEGEERGITCFDAEGNAGQGRTKRETKFPPISSNNLPSSSGLHGHAPKSSAKVQHVSSTVSLDNVSDADLYGHGDDASSTQDKGNNIPMDTQEPQDEHELYVDMNGANGNYYEMMYNQDNGLDSCNTLPPPPETYQDPGTPPPTYDQAIQIPGNDWVMVEDKDSNGLTNTISAMNIDENGHAARAISEVVGVRGVHGPSDIRRLKGASADWMSQTTPYYPPEFYYRTEPQGTSTKTRAIGSPVLKEHYRKVKGMRDRSSERSPLNGSDNDYKTPPTSFTRGFDNKQPEKSALNRPFEMGRDQSTKEKTDLQRRSTSSNSYDIMTSTKTTEYPKQRLTRSEPGEFMLKRISEPSVPKTTSPYMTSSYSKGSSTTDPSYRHSKHQSGVITRSQTRATAASKSDVTSDPLTGTSKTTQQMAERYNKENCIVCNSKATHYCVTCKKRSCRSCTTTVTRLPCDSYEEHLLVEVSPTTENETAVLGSKDVYSFRGVSAASHNCIYCSKESCGACRTIYTRDPCVLSKETHYFVDQQHRKSTSEKQETASQKQTTLSLKDKRPDPLPHGHVTGENYCEFCGLAANFICRHCLKTICDTCKHIYTQDLCPPTKREHQFENINEQSTNTNDAESKDSRSPWSCGRCTFLNSSSHRICAVCATSRGVNQVALPKSGTRKCQKCTYANEQGATVCKMCARTSGLDTPESYI